MLRTRTRLTQCSITGDLQAQFHGTLEPYRRPNESESTPFYRSPMAYSMPTAKLQYKIVCVVMSRPSIAVAKFSACRKSTHLFSALQPHQKTEHDVMIVNIVLFTVHGYTSLSTAINYCFRCEKPVIYPRLSLNACQTAHSFAALCSHSRRRNTTVPTMFIYHPRLHSKRPTAKKEFVVRNRSFANGDDVVASLKNYALLFCTCFARGLRIALRSEPVSILVVLPDSTSLNLDTVDP